MKEDAKTPGDSLHELEDLLGYRFSNRSLLVQALTHRSFVNEPGVACDPTGITGEGRENLKNNESLEFLGDSVLGFIISARIFQLFPELNEGELSKTKAYLVSAANLVQLAKEIRLGDFIFLSRGEEKTGGRTKRAIVVDTYEAIIGAVYLDGGVKAASDFIERQIHSILKDLDIKQLTYGDFKSALQEYLHNLGHPEPVYRVVDELGPDHKKTFVIQVLINDEVVAEASGKTKKGAQQSAARIALEKMKQSAVEGSTSLTPGSPQ
jgi:ribonuclease-3